MGQTLTVKLVNPSDDMRAAISYRCGHGCVRCGVTICVFAAPDDGNDVVDALTTSLLCPTCFGLLSKRPLSLPAYEALITRPVALDPRFDRTRLPYFSSLPHLSAGGMAQVRGTSIPILVSGHPPIAMVPPMTGTGAMRLDIRLANAAGEQEHIVRSNRWCGGRGDWSFAHLNGTYVIEATECESRLVLEFSTPSHLAVVHLLTMIEGRRVEMTPRWIEIDGARLTGVIASNRVIGFEV